MTVKHEIEKTRWQMVNIDKKIIERIKKVLAAYSYTSIADYVADAVRRRLEHHEIEMDIQTRKLERLEEMGE